MVDPSSIYSNIGDFQPQEDGWWYGKAGNHPGLKKNLSDLGVDVIHRGSDSNKSNLTPESGAAYYAEDTEELYLGDGSNWNAQGTWGKNPTYTSVSTEQLSHTGAEDVSASVQAALTSGLSIAVDSLGKTKTVSPANYATDDAALQALVDWIETNGNAGSIYSSSRRPDGTVLTIENTVSMDPSKTVPINWYFLDHASGQGSGNGVAITTTINDGSPMFDIIGNTTDNQNLSVEFEGCSWNLGDNNATLARFTRANNCLIRAGKVRRFAGDGIVMDSWCYDNQVTKTSLFPTDPTARGVVFKNTQGASAMGSDHLIGPFFKTDGEFGEGVSNPGGHVRVRVGGKIESAKGVANVENQAGSIILLPSLILGDCENGAHGFYHDGGYAMVWPCEVTNVSGDGLHFGPNTGTTHIASNIKYNNIGGDTIHFEGAPPETGYSVVPYENTVGGSVVYPSPPWKGLYYPDGWQIYRSGTATITAGSSSTVNTFSGRSGAQIKPEVWVDSAPASTVEIDYHTGFDTGSSQQSLIIEELTGSADVTVGWAVYRRGNSVNLI